MSSSFTSNLSEFTARVSQVHGRAVVEINDAMEIGVRRIANTAREMAPVDEGNLESSIKFRNEGRRRKWAAYVDETVPDDTGNYTIGDYIDFIHNGLYNLGPKSIAKQGASTGVMVGPRFMERAYDQEVQGVLAMITRIARKRFGN